MHLCIVPHNVVHIAPSCSCLIVFGPILTSASAWAWRGCSRWCASGWGAPRSPLLRNGIRGSTAPRGSACAATRALSGTNTTSCLSVRPLGPPVRLSRTSGAPLGTSPPAPGPTFHAAFRFTALHLSNRSGFQAPTIQEHVSNHVWTNLAKAFPSVSTMLGLFCRHGYGLSRVEGKPHATKLLIKTVTLAL